MAVAPRAPEPGRDEQERGDETPTGHQRWLRSTLAWAVVALAVIAGVGWLYLLRGVSALALGPQVPGALPLQQLAHDDAQPLARLALAWIPAGSSAALALLTGTQRSLRARAVGVGIVGWLLLLLAGAASDAAAISASVPSHLPAQLVRPGTWAAVVLLVIGARLVRSPGDRRRADRRPPSEPC